MFNLKLKSPDTGYEYLHYLSPFASLKEAQDVAREWDKFYLNEYYVATSVIRRCDDRKREFKVSDLVRPWIAEIEKIES